MVLYHHWSSLIWHEEEGFPSNVGLSKAKNDYKCNTWSRQKLSPHIPYLSLNPKKVYVSLSLSSIITFFFTLSFSSIAFLQINFIAFLLIPISPPCSLPHQHEHSRSFLMIMKVVFSIRAHYKQVLVALISSGYVLFFFFFFFLICKLNSTTL